MQLYNVIAELDVSVDKLSRTQIEAMVDTLTGYHPAVGRGVFGQAEVTVSVPAETLRQAMTTALAVLADALPDREAVTFAVMTADEFDRRSDLGAVGELVSVSEAAAELNVSRQRVLKRIEAGNLPAYRVGQGWVLPRAGVLRALRRREEDLAAGA